MLGVMRPPFARLAPAAGPGPASTSVTSTPRRRR
jgi:hypothetical protein